MQSKTKIMFQVRMNKFNLNKLKALKAKNIINKNKQKQKKNNNQETLLLL